MTKNAEKTYFSSDFKLGILGGGQLGKMLLYETQKFDIQTFVLDPNQQAPCKVGCYKFVCGSLLDFDSVYDFGKQVDLLTFEIEQVNVEALEKLEQEGTKVFPSAKTLRIIQNKGKQKQFYRDNNLPTSDFELFKSTSILKSKILDNNPKFPFVWKSTELGYDGKGVKVIQKIEDLEELPNVECITEKLIDFKTELAVIVARNSDGMIKTYPVVEMEFHPQANQVEYVICPARIDEKIAENARKIALRVSEKLQHVGVLAVEMFQTQNDEILINETAPRPHNSGHYSIEASYTSQFEQHLRAILNLPLGNTDNKTTAVMVNLVGEKGFYGKVIYQNMEKILELEGVTSHIYGKKQTHPFRKMGHITITNKQIAMARKIAEQVKNTIRVIGY